MKSKIRNVLPTGSAAKLAFPVTLEMFGGADSHTVNGYNAQISIHEKNYGLRVDPVEGTYGILQMPATRLMVTFHYLGIKNVPQVIYLPKPCFKPIYCFEYGDPVMYTREAESLMLADPNPNQSATLYKLDAKEKGLIVKKSIGTVTEVNDEKNVITVKFEHGAELDQPAFCFMPIVHQK